jgi:hypothetical protein
MEKGFAVHISASHTEYWSALRYLTQPSEKKLLEDLDVNPLLVGIAREDLFRMSQRPFHAKTHAAILERNQAQSDRKRINVSDALTLIMRYDLYSEAKIRQFAETRASESERAFFRAADVKNMLHGYVEGAMRARDCQGALEREEKSNEEVLQDAAAAACSNTSSSNCEYIELLEDLFRTQGVNLEELLQKIAHGICHGHKKAVQPALAINGPSHSGKSTLLYGIRAIFSHEMIIFTPPNGSFGFTDFFVKRDTARVCLLDECNPARLQEQVGAMGLRNLLNGEEFLVQLPKSQYSKDYHCDYKVPSAHLCTLLIPQQGIYTIAIRSS